jgi:hypothetical protein
MKKLILTLGILITLFFSCSYPGYYDKDGDWHGQGNRDSRDYMALVGSAVIAGTVIYFATKRKKVRA